MKDSVLKIWQSESKLIPFLVSRPGCGKTQMVQELAIEGNKTLTILNMASIDELDFSGPPVAIGDGKSDQLVPKFWSSDIIFFDEIDRVKNTSVINTLLSVFRDRALNGKKITAKLIAAGNQEHDEECSIFDKKSAFYDRLVRLDFGFSEESLISYYKAKYTSDLARFVCTNLSLVQDFTPRRIEDALILGVDFLSNVLDSRISIAFTDFMNKKISLEGFFAGEKLPDDKVLIMCLVSECADNIIKILEDNEKLAFFKKFFTKQDAEIRLSFFTDLKFKFKHDTKNEWIELFSKKAPELYTEMVGYF